MDRMGNPNMPPGIHTCRFKKSQQVPEEEHKKKQEDKHLPGRGGEEEKRGNEKDI